MSLFRSLQSFPKEHSPVPVIKARSGMDQGQRWICFLQGFQKYLFFKKKKTTKLYLAAPGLRCRMQVGSYCALWGLVPWPGIEPGTPSLGAQSLSPWTTKEVSRNNSYSCLPVILRVGLITMPWFTQLRNSGIIPTSCFNFQSECQWQMAASNLKFLYHLPPL